MKKSSSFLDFFDSRIEYLLQCNRLGTAINYRRAKASLEKYLQGRPLTFRDINAAFVDAYSDWLAKRGLIKNSQSFHMRILRAVYNKGVKKGLTKQTYPFTDTYTGIDKTAKRHITNDVIWKLNSLEFQEGSLMKVARDMFFFSLYTRGMAFVDMAYLRKECIQGGCIIYKRKKSNSIMRIKLEKEISSILTRYITLCPSSPYIFPILHDTTEVENHSLYLRALASYNQRLKRMARLIGFHGSLSSYTARHTWASVVYKMEVPVSVISAALGHSSEKVTRIYLDSLDSSSIDKANRKFLKAITRL